MRSLFSKYIVPYLTRRKLRRLFRFALVLLIAAAGKSVVTVAVYRFVNPPATILMAKRTLHGIAPSARSWTPYSDIPQAMIDAVVASEDNNFATHWGFEWSQMKDAFRDNRRGRRFRGASTITQQMCKNVFLWERRSYFRKGLEAWFTVWVELLWSKERIMEVYLNVVEMGRGIYGIEAASEYYFHHPASRLTQGEAALIAATLPSPLKRNPAKPSAYLRTRQQQILSLMRKIGKTEL